MQGTILHTICFIWHGMPDLSSSLGLRVTELNSHLTGQWYNNGRGIQLRSSVLIDLCEHSSWDRQTHHCSSSAPLSLNFNQGPEITLRNFTGRWSSQGNVSGPGAASTPGGKKHRHHFLPPLESLRPSSSLPLLASLTVTSRRGMAKDYAVSKEGLILYGRQWAPFQCVKG